MPVICFGVCEQRPALAPLVCRQAGCQPSPLGSFVSTALCSQPGLLISSGLMPLDWSWLSSSWLEAQEEGAQVCLQKSLQTYSSLTLPTGMSGCWLYRDLGKPCIWDPNLGLWPLLEPGLFLREVCCRYTFLRRQITA